MVLSRIYLCVKVPFIHPVLIKYGAYNFLWDRMSLPILYSLNFLRANWKCPLHSLMGRMILGTTFFREYNRRLLGSVTRDGRRLLPETAFTRPVQSHLPHLLSRYGFNRPFLSVRVLKCTPLSHYLFLLYRDTRSFRGRSCQAPRRERGAEMGLRHRREFRRRSIKIVQMLRRTSFPRTFHFADGRKSLQERGHMAYIGIVKPTTEISSRTFNPFLYQGKDSSSSIISYLHDSGRQGRGLLAPTVPENSSAGLSQKIIQ